MNIIEKNLDAYQIADYIFNNKFEDKDIITIENLEITEYFEMLSIIFLEGMFKFCKHSINENNKFNLNLLKIEDIHKINSYLKKINVQLNFNAYTLDNWNLEHKTKFTNYKDLTILDSTKLEDLKNIFYVENMVYLINGNNKIE